MTDPARGRDVLPVAATVVILRDRPTGLEALLVHRATHLAFAGGHWVFPGGRVVNEDRNGLGADDALETPPHGPVEHFATRLDTSGSAPVAMYHGDAGYQTIDASVPGPRHRLVMGAGSWNYDRDDALVHVAGDI